MSEELKRRMGGKCRELGEHQGPSDPDNSEDCWACSWAHVEEFGDCEGIVEEFVVWNPGSPDEHIGPEVDVRWQPSNLRYAYLPSMLVEV